MKPIFPKIEAANFWTRLKFRLFGKRTDLGKGVWMYEHKGIVYLATEGSWP